MIGQILPGTTVQASYVGDEGDFSRYRFSVNGTDVIDAIIDNSDPNLQIHICAASADHKDRVPTNGVAKKTLHEIPAADGGPIPDGIEGVHIDGITVYSYVVPRLLRFITALHVTKA